MYEPPLFLGMPDAWAATICAVPLAVSATRWPALLSNFIGLAIGFLAAHAFIMALQHEFPPSVFYWMTEQATVVPFSLATIASELVLLYAASHFVRGLWQADYLRAAGYLLLVLTIVASAIGLFAYLVRDAHVFEGSSTEFAEITIRSSQPANAESEITITPIDCVFPPFGEGVTGYSMLAVLVIFEILVAVGIADRLNREPVPITQL
jgi:hypothetical protein